MKNKGWVIALIIALACLVIILITVMVRCINGSFRISKMHFRKEISKNLILDKAYPGLLEQIKIDTDASDIEIKATTDTRVRVVAYGEEERLDVQANDNKLSIHFTEKKCFGFCFHVKQSKIIVYLPNTYDKSILIENHYGDIAIDSFRKASIEVDEDCGDVSILGGREIIVSNNYGDIKIGEGSIITVNEKAGDVTITQGEEIHVENDYGDIYIKEALRKITIRENCGDVKVDHLNLKADSTVSNHLGDIKIGTTNKIYIDAKTSLGDVRVNRNDRKGEVTLTLENSCGDIRVDN